MLPPNTIEPSSPRLPNGQEAPRFGALIPMPSHDLVPAGGYPWNPVPAPQALAPAVTAGNLLHSFRRRWWIGAGLGVLAAIGAALAAWNLVPVRQSVAATLQVRRGDEFSIEAYQRAPTAEEMAAFKLTQAALLKQKLSLMKALGSRDTDTSFELWKNPEVRKHGDPVTWLEEALKVDFFEGSDLMMVSLSGEDAKELAKIVNAVVKVYLEGANERDAAIIRGKRTENDKSISAAQERLNSTYTKLGELATQLGVGDSVTANAKIQTQLHALQSLSQQIMHSENELAQVTQELMQAQVDVKAMKDRVISEHEIEAQLMGDKIYQDKTAKLAELTQAATRVLGSVKDPSSPKVKHVKSMIEAMEQELDEHRERMRPAIEATLVDPTRVQQLEGSIVGLTELQKKLSENVASMKTQWQTQSAELAKIGGNSSQLDFYRSEIKLAEADLALFRGQKSRIDMLAAQPPRVQLLAEATRPEATSEMLRYLAVAFAAAFGFGLPIVGITFWDFQQHRVNLPTDASSALGTKILGALPSVAGRKGRKATEAGKGKAGATALQRSLADCVDGVRTALLRDTASEGTRVVLVSSAVHHEGKTTLATQLAASLARAGKRTLLIDGDLRKPVAHRLYGLSLDPGLCEVLRGECELEETLRPTRASGLWMMTAGRCDDESLQELAKDGVDDLFKQLRSGFDYIIIDASPVLASADALVIGQYVDAAVISVLRDASRVPSVLEACERLRGVGVRVLGTVFNGTKTEIKPVGRAKRLPSKAAL